MPGLLTNGSRRFSIYSAITAMTLGSLAACGGGDDDTTTTTPTVPVVPTEVPTAPQSVTAAATPSVTKSVTVSWTAPASGAPIDSYVLYRSIEPDIAGDLTKAQKIEDVTSPYVDSVPAGGVPFYYVVAAVNSVGEGAVSAEDDATPTSPTGDTGYGNNLSVPIVFADGVGVTGGLITLSGDYEDTLSGLRPTATELPTISSMPSLNDADLLRSAGVDYYVQKNASTWQASWTSTPGVPQKVVVDWGDNLRTASLTTGMSLIRVETNLLQNKAQLAADGLSTPWPDTESMQGYPMKLLAGQGATEVQGTTGLAEEAVQRRIFTVNARLTIQRLDELDQVVPGFPPGCLFDGSIAAGFGAGDGPGIVKYVAEINVAGAVTYGFNWRLNDTTKCALTPEERAGKYRVTFSLDDSSTLPGDPTIYANNVSLDSLDVGDLGEGTPPVLVDAKTTYIDVVVTQ